MQTIASLVKRLDMSAEEALEKLRYMLFEVDSVDSPITDEECDLLIDVDEDPSVADKVREAKLEEQDKARKRVERLQEAAKKAAAKRKVVSKKAAAKKEKAGVDVPVAAEKKPAAKKKPAARKKAAAKKTRATGAERAVLEGPSVSEVKKEDVAALVRGEPFAEILPPLTPEEEAAKKAARKKTKEAEGKAGPKLAEPALKIGSAIEHEDRAVELVRADGTHVEAPELVVGEPLAAAADEEETLGVLAEAERRQEEEDRRALKIAARPLPKPDPAVVAEVIRKAAEREQVAKGAKAGRLKVKGKAKERTPQEELDALGGRAVQLGAARKTGKTARKRQKRAERSRVAEELLRRDAAAAVREYQAGALGGVRKRKKKRTRPDEADTGVEAESLDILEVEHAMTVEQLAQAMEVPVNDLILELMDHNVLVNKNEALSMDAMEQLAEAHGFEVRAVIPEEAEVLAEESEDPADLVPRAPVITVMGHVDHGKTTLLDKVRSANVVEGEAGGITQHIAAYDVAIGKGRVVFLDTPGHEAFTQMRARGARITDVVVLVVAADDGVMPQTIEAINHAKAAEVAIVVAINKCDKPDAQPDRIRQELTKYDLLSEEWGGKTIMKNISALTGEGIGGLIELLVLESEMLELKANPKKRARGTIIESEITRGLGPVAWVLVQNGTLRVGDFFLAGRWCGRVRALQDSRGKSVPEAGPATPVVVTGFDAPPDAGDTFAVVQDERVAKAIAEKRADLAKAKQMTGMGPRRITLENFHEQLMAGEKRALNIVLKADVQGSVDVMQSSLGHLGNEEVRAHIVHAGVGGINESDVLLASASDAVVLGFHVGANVRARKLAEQEGVEIRTYNIIYEVIDAVRSSIEGMLAPTTKEAIVGHLEVRATFRSSAYGNIAGCYQQDGEAVRNSPARLLRDGIVVYDGKIASLRRGKEDVRSVSAGFECGIKLENFEDVKVGDVIEVYRIDTVASTLS
jgi:translation initiation factor IF-2